jgi:hypothetical protein
VDGKPTPAALAAAALAVTEAQQPAAKPQTAEGDAKQTSRHSSEESTAEGEEGSSESEESEVDYAYGRE